MSFLFSLFLGCKLITTETIGSFNPFEMKAFRCPVCQSEKFVEVKPYGGVWCAECNAAFSVKGTCDGHRKLAVSCRTEHCWKEEYRNKADFYGTVIWQGDKEIGWLAIKDRRVIHFP